MGMKNMARRYVLGVSSLLLVSVCVAAPTQEANKIMATLAKEKMMHVGEALPAGIQVNDRAGNSVDLRQALAGPATVLIVKPGCEPCTEMVDYLRSHPVLSGAATIAVVRVEDDGSAAIQLPPQVKVFYTKARGGQGFLASTLYPTTFFFNRSLILRGRRSALMGSPARTLETPPPHAIKARP